MFRAPCTGYGFYSTPDRSAQSGMRRQSTREAHVGYVYNSVPSHSIQAFFETKIRRPSYERSINGSIHFGILRTLRRSDGTPGTVTSPTTGISAGPPTGEIKRGLRPPS